MIAMITPLPIGNAVRLVLRPPGSASLVRLLRKDVAEFEGPDDAAAVVVSEEPVDGQATIVDHSGLDNGKPYYYRPFYFLSDWVAGEVAVAVPQSSYTDRSVDAFSIVLDRVAAGLKVEVDRGKLKHETGEIPVLSAPPAFEDTRWPVVTVDLSNDAPSARGIGELLEPDQRDGQEWTESEGWLAKTQLSITGWCLNPDERIEMRKALRRIVIGNLPVFEGAGLSEIEFSQQHAQDFESYGTPVYQVICSLNCMAPALISGRLGDVSDVKTNVSVAIQP